MRSVGLLHSITDTKKGEAAAAAPVYVFCLPPVRLPVACVEKKK